MKIWQGLWLGSTLIYAAGKLLEMPPLSRLSLSLSTIAAMRVVQLVTRAFSARKAALRH